VRDHVIEAGCQNFVLFHWPLQDATAKTRIDLPVAIKVILSIVNSILWMFKLGTLRFKFTVSRFLRFLEPDRFPILCNFLTCSQLQWFFGFVIGLTPVTNQNVAVFWWCMWQFHTHQSYTTTEKYLDLLSQALEVMCSSSLFLECCWWDAHEMCIPVKWQSIKRRNLHQFEHEDSRNQDSKNLECWM
jgi:hypothetical protein